MAYKAGKFLRIFFGCHARPDRSFYFRGKQFPICARCTGELAGILSGIPIAFILGYPSFGVVILMMLPLVADGFLQRLTSYESTNTRRFLTGILFGIAFIFAFIYFHCLCITIAGSILKLFGADPSAVDRLMGKFM
ncbi:MAG: DUF2085 domain-containing protein [Lachnospiraceae bacterium]|nr:DUF2085 domain-containing protein [Lachnospiraceae bacterium]